MAQFNIRERLDAVVLEEVPLAPPLVLVLDSDEFPEEPDVTDRKLAEADDGFWPIFGSTV